jgi:hypothetical protein
MLDDYYQERGWDSQGNVPNENRNNIDQLISLLDKEIQKV